MLQMVIALFGEAQRGKLQTPYLCRDLQQLFEFFGEPPKETIGLFFAVQALLQQQPLIYFRVQEEGESIEDYLSGLQLLRESTPSVIQLRALFLPGVGSKALIDEGLALCKSKQSLLLMNEADFYDYLTQHSS